MMKKVNIVMKAAHLWTQEVNPAKRKVGAL